MFWSRPSSLERLPFVPTMAEGGIPSPVVGPKPCVDKSDAVIWALDAQSGVNQAAWHKFANYGFTGGMGLLACSDPSVD